jgi:hydroxymethylbilane synthase
MATTVSPPATLTIGTRGSPLALWQTDHIAGLLATAWPGLDCRIERFSTAGDRIIDQPLPEIGGKGLFTAELETALLDGAIDLAVHSLKDLPVVDPPGLVLGAITGRADVRDALVARGGGDLSGLPQGAVVGTSSLRRQAQLLAARPDLTIRSIRGNVETRVNKVMQGEYEAAVLALAGLSRLGLEARVTRILPLEVMLPAPGQGALAVQCRADDILNRRLLAAIDDAGVRACVTAEREFLNALGGGCATPVAAYARPIAGDMLHLTGLIAAVDGRRIIRLEASGSDPIALGSTLAGQALEQGAREILEHAG